MFCAVPAAMGCLGGKTEEERLDEKAKREANKKIERQLQKERQTYKATHRLLLLGPSAPHWPCSPLRLCLCDLMEECVCVQVQVSPGKAP